LKAFSEGKMREMHVHQLPWPKDALEELGETAVRVRITLSYFIEPNPGRRGWRRRHRYASYELRFDFKCPTESADEFRKRLNQRALDEDEENLSPMATPQRGTSENLHATGDQFIRTSGLEPPLI